LGAFCYFRLCQDGWSADPEADSRKGADLARLFGGLDVRHRNRDDGAQPLDDPAGLVSCLRNPEQRELYLSGLRLAMGEPA